jgi:hypothetical protein
MTSMRRCIRTFAACALALLIGSTATAQVRTEFSACSFQCFENLPSHLAFVECGGYPGYVLFAPYGRYWWGPLRCAAAIRVSIQALHDPSTRYPLYVQVLDHRTANCVSRPGITIWQTDGTGGTCNPDSLWVTSPPIDLPAIIGTGTEYWLQIQGLWTNDGTPLGVWESPFVGCIRLTLDTTSIAATTWTAVKSIYR